MNAQAVRGGVVASLLGAAGWAALALSGSGINVGEGPGAGSTALMLALVVSALGAAAVVWISRADPLWRSAPLRLAVAGLGGLTILTAASVMWALQPHLAWIEANQAALYLLVMVIAAGVAARIRPAATGLAALTAAAAAVPVVAALAIETLPGVLGNDFDPGRLGRPTGYHNALGLIAAVGLIGLAAGNSRRRLALGATAAGTTLFLTALALTLSRGAVLALIAGLIALALLGGVRRSGIVPLLIGAGAAVLPIAWGLSRDVLTDERVATGLREEPGLILGLVLLGAMAVGAVAAVMLAGRRGRGGGAIALALVCALALALPSVEAGASVAAPGDSAIDNQPDRVLSFAGNNRGAWWGEAIRGFQDAPLVGNGAGSFRLVHLRERRDDSSLFITRQPHQIGLKLLSDLGIAGLSLLILWIVGLILALVRARRAGRSAAVAPAAALLVAFLVQAQIDWSFSIPALGALAAAAGGVVLAAGVDPSAETAESSSPGLGAGAGALVVLLVVVSAVLPWLSLREVAAAERAATADDVTEAIERARTAGDLNPLSPRPLEEESFAHIIAGDIPAAAAARVRLTRLQPDNPFAWAGLAALLSGDAREEAWRRVLALDPNNQDARRALGLLS